MLDKSKRIPCEKEDLIGLWSLDGLYHSDFENTMLILYPNGEGFINWYQLEYETFNCFQWTVNEGRLTVKGTKMCSFEGEELQQVDRSDLGEKEIKVWKTIRKNLAEEDVEALVFSEPLDISCEEAFGLVSKDIAINEYYQKIRELIGDESYTHLLKTGDTVVFKTDMPKEEVQTLPIFSNQYAFNSYFKNKGYRLQIEIIIKKGP